MARRRSEDLDEVRIVVERGGFGARKWRWRLAKDCGLSVGMGRGFSSAEDAYEAAQQSAFALRASREVGRMAGAVPR